MINKKLSEIDKSDIQRLIDDSVKEGKTIDYKQQYSLDKENEKGEFLADVSSFANAAGGDLIFGIEEEDMVAVAVKPFEVKSVDVEQRRIEDIIRNGIEPRIRFEIKFMPIDDGVYVLIIRVAKSWNSPNRVTYNASAKHKNEFYSRNSTGKYQLDVAELRNAFNLSESLTEKIENFRQKRVADILSEDTPVQLMEGGKIILHIIPIESWGGRNLDIGRIRENEQMINTLSSDYWSYRTNLNGLISISKSSQDKAAFEYTQIYRNGIIETVDSRYLRSDVAEAYKKYYADTIELKLIEKLNNSLQLLQKLEIGTPIMVALTIYGANGLYISSRMIGFGGHEERNKINEQVIFCPEHLIEDYAESTEDILRPMFDVIRNTGGYNRSFNFDEKGKRIKRQQ